MESRQLQTNIAESQSLQPRSADSLPSRSIQVIRKADPSLVESTKLLDPMLEEAEEYCNHRAYVGDSQSETSTTD